MGKKEDSAKERYLSAAKSFEEAIKNNTGIEGYKASLDAAKEGAGEVAKGIQGQVTSAVRNAGMTKAQAVTQGSAAANKGYYDALTGQQAAAQGSQAAGVQGYGTLLQSNQQERQNAWNRGAGLATGLLGSAGTLMTGTGDLIAGLAQKNGGSDERLKNYIKVSSYFEPDEKTKEIEALIWRRPND